MKNLLVPIGVLSQSKESTTRPKSSDALRSAVTVKDQDQTEETQAVGREMDES